MITSFFFSSASCDWLWAGWKFFQVREKRKQSLIKYMSQVNYVSKCVKIQKCRSSRSYISPHTLNKRNNEVCWCGCGAAAWPQVSSASLQAAIVTQRCSPTSIPWVRSQLGRFPPTSDSFICPINNGLVLLWGMWRSHRATGETQLHPQTPAALLLTLPVRLALLALVFLWIILGKVMMMRARGSSREHNLPQGHN